MALLHNAQNYYLKLCGQPCNFMWDWHFLLARIGGIPLRTELPTQSSGQQWNSAGYEVRAHLDYMTQPCNIGHMTI